jgi:hypothetical protein
MKEGLEDDESVALDEEKQSREREKERETVCVKEREREGSPASFGYNTNDWPEQGRGAN